MSLTNYIYGSLVWVGIGCISCFSYIVIGVSSLVMMFLPSAQMKRHISEHMTDIVSTYGFREETVDVSGVKIHCVIKDNVTEHGLTSGGGGLVHLTAPPPPTTYLSSSTEPPVRLSYFLML